MTENELTVHFPVLEKELIAEMIEVGTIKTVPAGDVLMRTGRYIRSAMLVLDGLVKIYQEDEEGNEFFMYYLDAGKACALSLLCSLRQDTSRLTAKAVAETTVLVIPLRYIDQWMAKYKCWYQFVLGTCRERFEELLQTIDHIAFRNMDGRLVFI